ncbi:hypothetical protein D3C87_1703170 [compost metagenome]
MGVARGAHPGVAEDERAADHVPVAEEGGAHPGRIVGVADEAGAVLAQHHPLLARAGQRRRGLPEGRDGTEGFDVVGVHGVTSGRGRGVRASP